MTTGVFFMSIVNLKNKEDLDDLRLAHGYK